MIHEENGQIIVDELRPMSDAPRDKTTFIGMLGCQFVVFVYSGYGDFFNDGISDFASDQFKGWIPMPIYRPKDGK